MCYNAEEYVERTQSILYVLAEYGIACINTHPSNKLLLSPTAKAFVLQLSMSS